jgi:hypothetical protein
MEPLNKKKRGCETLSYSPEAVEGITERALEESHVKVARLKEEVSQLGGEVTALNCASST